MGITKEGTDHNPGGDKDGPMGPWPWTATYLGPPCDPHHGWRIINGRLFCALSSKIMTLWVRLGASGVNEGDNRWKAWFGGLDKGPLNTGCWPGDSADECLKKGKPFPNRTAESILI